MDLVAGLFRQGDLGDGEPAVGSRRSFQARINLESGYAAIVSDSGREKST
ncbi:MAG: hypothetical protein ACRDWA_18350 [Acidimicrobiia bacterium]